MNDKVKIAIIAAVGVVAAVALYSYFSPYNTCVRGLQASGEGEFRAHFLCAKLLGGGGGGSS